MATRDELLAAASDDDQQLLLGIIKKHHSSSDPFDVTELLSSLSAKQHEELWGGLQVRVTSTLLGFDVESEEEAQQQEFQTASETLQAIILLANASLDNTEPDKIPLTLFEVVVVLHGIIITLPEDAEKLQQSIVKLCESWWHKNLMNRVEVGANTVTFLLQQILQPKCSRTVLKRVWAMREYFALVNWTNVSSNFLKNLLLQLPLSSQVLKFDEGRKILGFMLSFSADIVEEFHKVIKSQVIYCPKTMLHHYGEVYLRAWKVATGETKQKLEEDCIQDLMFLAIHTKRSSSKSPAMCLQRVLSYLHQHKQQPGVDSLLLRLYDPILWRSLKAANSVVRANAAAILFDIFPLQDTENIMEDNEQLMQKQFDVIPTLLFDPCPSVRVVAVHGVSSICQLYWELIPAEVISELLNKLVNDLAWDGSSGEVRVAVLKAMILILDNPLSHPVLKMMLPRLQNILHDSSEQVRAVMCDLLLKVKGMRIIKFWTICPMEHLLAQLELGNKVVSLRIVNLLFNSYLPLDKDPQTQISRVIHLIQTNPAAARNFFVHAYKHMSVSSMTKVILLLGRFIRQCVKKELEKRGAYQEEEDEEEDEDEEGVDAEKENEEGEITIDDTDLMAGFLETIVILWKAMPKQPKSADADGCKWLQAYFSRALPSFFKVFQDPRIVSCLVLIAGHLPPNAIPTFSRSTVSKLRAMDENSPSESYGTVLEAMCQWGKAADVLELVSDWLEKTWQTDDNAPDKPNKAGKDFKNRRSGRVVMFEEPEDPKPTLALDYILYLTGHAVCREQLIEKNKTQTRQLTNVLKDVLTVIEKRFESTDPVSDLCSDKLLVQAFEVYCRLEILLHDPNNKEASAITVIEHLLSWADTQLVPMLKQRQKKRLLNTTNMTLMEGHGDTAGESTLMSTTLLAPKRSAGEGQMPALVELSSDLLMKLLTVASNMMLVGVGDRELASHLADFATLLLKTEETVSTRFLPLISTLMYQVTEFTLMLDQTGGDDEGLGGQANVVSDMLTKVTGMIATLTKTKKEQAARILPTVKPALTEVLCSYYRHQAMKETTPEDYVMASIAKSVVMEMTSTVRRDPTMDKCLTINELPLLTAFYLTIARRRKDMMSNFIKELESNVKSSERIESLTGAAHVFFTLSKITRNDKDEMKSLVSTAKLQLESLTLPPDLSEESPLRMLKTAAGDLLKESMTQLGGIL